MGKQGKNGKKEGEETRGRVKEDTVDTANGIVLLQRPRYEETLLCCKIPTIYS